MAGMDPQAAALIAQQSLALPPGSLVQAHAIRGGLESAVARVRVRAAGRRAPQLPRSLVVKELLGAQRREAHVYRLLWETVPQPPVARVLGCRHVPGASYLCLEDVRAASAWPWRDPAATQAVCEALARLHRAGIDAAGLPAWNYEQHLGASAEETLRLAATTRAGAGLVWRRPGDLRRVVGALPRLRERLLESGATLIHGDVHPGNVLVRAGAREPRIVLIDWAASRIGSPLEDIACWLHSLGCWDSEARRRHDSLLAAYLRARQPAARLDDAVRDNYWIASASNGLAGAIRYHFAVLVDGASGSRARRASLRALAEWQRVMRGAAALLAAGARA